MAGYDALDRHRERDLGVLISGIFIVSWDLIIQSQPLANSKFSLPILANTISSQNWCRQTSYVRDD